MKLLPKVVVVISIVVVVLVVVVAVVVVIINGKFPKNKTFFTLIIKNLFYFILLPTDFKSIIVDIQRIA